ncbi:MAG: hypothetical protein ABIE84_07305 [bacterium]
MRTIRLSLDPWFNAAANQPKPAPKVKKGESNGPLRVVTQAEIRLLMALAADCIRFGIMRQDLAEQLGWNEKKLPLEVLGSVLYEAMDCVTDKGEMFDVPAGHQALDVTQKGWGSEIERITLGLVVWENGQFRLVPENLRPWLTTEILETLWQKSPWDTEAQLDHYFRTYEPTAL